MPLRTKVIEVIGMTNYFERRGVWEHPVTKVSRCTWVWMFIMSFSLRVISVTGLEVIFGTGSLLLHDEPKRWERHSPEWLGINAQVCD